MNLVLKIHSCCCVHLLQLCQLDEYSEAEAVSPISVLGSGHGALQDLVSRGRGMFC